MARILALLMLLLLAGFLFLLDPCTLKGTLFLSQDTYLRKSFWDYRGIGNQLSPVHFKGSKPRWVSCYALLRGWLLLSQPSQCLRSKTPLFTLSQYFGALTTIRVVSLSDWELTPQPLFRPSQMTIDSEFDRAVKTFASYLLDQCSTP